MPLEFIKTAGVAAADYKDDLEVIVSDPLLAALPDGDPLKVSKKIPLGALPTRFQDWDVTPTIVTDVITLAITENFQATELQDGSITLDYTDAPIFNGSQAVYHGCAVKTNLDLSKLTVGSAIHVGYEITSVAPTYAPFLIGFVLTDGTKTAEEVTAGVMAETVTGSAPPITHATIISNVAMFGVQKQTNIAWTIPNDINPAFADADGQLHIRNQPFLANLDLGSKVIMALGRQANSISVANIGIAPNGTTYDIMDADSIDNNPVLPADTTLFYFIVGLDFGQGYPIINIKPTVTAAPPSYDVTGTTYNTAHGGTNGTWATLFPDPITTPSSTIVTHAEFPENAVVGRGLRAIVDPNYTSDVVPAPYGKQVTHHTKCIVDNVTPGDEDFTPLIGTNELAGVNAAISAAQSQLTVLSQSVATAAKNSSMGEIVLYVRADPLDSAETPIPAGPTVFDTFDLAYTYAVTLPKYLKKRIVLDDRVITTFKGIEHPAVDGNSPTTFKVYALLANNITISSYVVYNSLPLALPYNPNVTLYFACDGLRLEDFSGYTAALIDSFSGFTPMFDIFTGVNGPNGVQTEDNLILGKNSYLVSSSAHIGIELGGTVVIGNDATWIHTAHAVNQSQFSESVIIAKARYGKLTLSGGVEPLAYNGVPAFTVITEHGGVAIVNNLSDATAVVINYTDIAVPAPFSYGSYRIVESVADLIRGNSFNGGTTELNLSNQYTYFIVGVVDIGGIILNVVDDTNGEKTKFIGLPGSKITGSSVIFSGVYPPPAYNPILEIIGVDVATTNPNAPAIYLFGSLILKGLTVFSDRMITVIDIEGQQTAHDFEARDVKFLNTNGGFISFKGEINVRGNVTLEGIYAKLNPGVELFTIDIKPINNPYGQESKPRNQCNINDVTILFSEAVSLNTRIFDLGGYDYQVGHFGVYSHGQIKVSNVTVNFEGSNTNGRYELFSRGGNVYDHQNDSRIAVDGGKSFAFINGSGAYLNNLDNTPQVFQFLDPAGMCDFTVDGVPVSTLKYTGKTSKMFELLLSFTVQTTAPNVTLNIDVRQNTLNINHGTSQSLLVTAGERYSDSITLPVLLRPEDNITLLLHTNTNCNLSFGNFRMSVKEV